MIAAAGDSAVGTAGGLRPRGSALGSLAVLCVLWAGVSGCTTRPQLTPNERLQQQAAQDARQMHHDLKDAGKEAGRALRQAGQATRAIVSGARQGWAEGAPQPNGKRIDINHASISDLEVLPGIRLATARRIVARRPFKTTQELITEGLVTHAEYAKISPEIEAR